MCQHTRSSLLGKAEFAQSVLSSELRKIEPVNQTRKTKNWSCPSAKNPVSSPVLQGHQTIVFRARGAIHVGDSLVMTSFEGWYIRLDLAKLGSRTELYFDPSLHPTDQNGLFDQQWTYEFCTKSGTMDYSLWREFRSLLLKMCHL